MATLIRSRGRLKFGVLELIDGVEFFDLLDLPTVPEQPDDISYSVISPDRIDLIAKKFYGEEALWWVIAVANNIEKIPQDLQVGDIIRIPSPRFISQEFFQKTQANRF